MVSFVGTANGLDGLWLETFMVPSWYVFSGVTFKILESPGLSKRTSTISLSAGESITEFASDYGFRYFLEKTPYLHDGFEIASGQIYNRSYLLK